MERGVCPELGAPRRGNKSIAQWQATKGSDALGNRGEEVAPCKGQKSYIAIASSCFYFCPFRAPCGDVRYIGRCPMLCSVAPSGRLSSTQGS